MKVRRAGAVAAALAVIALAPSPASASTPPSPGSSPQTAAVGVQASGSTHPPTGYLLSPRRVMAIADRDPKVRRARHRHHALRPQVSTKAAGRWQVSYFAGRRELVQVTLLDAGGRVLESWDGVQVAWLMARGYPGAFGRKINAPWVWLPLCALFLAAFFDRRRPLRLANLDLVALLAFGVSHLFFNRAEIGLSVPLAYPVLAYLLARMLWVGFRGGGEALRPAVPIAWLALGLLFLIGFRVALNVADSNVIDVGYSGVIGADRIAHGDPVYGGFPKDDQSGDTYGPVAYYAYVPFEQALPWSGRWDSLPAAHGAAIFFDLATILGLWLVGRRLRAGRRGRELGTTLAFAWAAYPYTAFVLCSNSNDSLVAMLLVYAFLALGSPAARGAVLALASATKFAPLALAPLFARAAGAPPSRRALAGFALAFAATTALVMFQVAIEPGLSEFFDRTLGFQASRGSPFGIWGQAPGLEWLQTALKVAVAGLALAVGLRPRTRTPARLAALGAAVLIALQLTVEHWFYLYIVWFLPYVLIALMGDEDVEDKTPPASGKPSAGLARAGHLVPED